MPRWRPLLALVTLVVLGLAATEIPTRTPEIPNARSPLDGVWSGGQPTAEQIGEAAEAGFRTVINLRGAGEPGYEWEAEAVERLGLRYVHIPVAGAAGLTRENVERLDVALRDALPNGPVLLHCGSGNRIGAMLALREAWLRGATSNEALRLGLAAGLTRLEPEVRTLLELPLESPAPTAPAAPTP